MQDVYFPYVTAVLSRDVAAKSFNSDMVFPFIFLLALQVATLKKFAL
jgi:hypothetical protein